MNHFHLDPNITNYNIRSPSISVKKTIMESELLELWIKWKKIADLIPSSLPFSSGYSYLIILFLSNYVILIWNIPVLLKCSFMWQIDISKALLDSEFQKFWKVMTSIVNLNNWLYPVQLNSMLVVNFFSSK